jgi:NADP-dependent 3-hydroxy acid dehydrogenase YdfG
MNGKVCIVTGASSGIGRAAAILFAKNNARVVAVGRNVEELKKLQTEAQTADRNVTIQIADARDSTQIEKLVSDTADAFGQIDVLVNAAGIIMNGSIENTTLDD